jgi:hypothetical protein
MRYILWKPSVLSKKLRLSYLTNYQIKPKERFSFILQQFYVNSQHRFYSSQNKLQCFLSYSFSVPSRKVGVSRFYINKGVERLIFGGYQKQ